MEFNFKINFIEFRTYESHEQCTGATEMKHKHNRQGCLRKHKQANDTKDITKQQNLVARIHNFNCFFSLYVFVCVLMCIINTILTD